VQSQGSTYPRGRFGSVRRPTGYINLGLQYGVVFKLSHYPHGSWTFSVLCHLPGPKYHLQWERKLLSSGSTGDKSRGC